jgi:hypothetical protein
VDPNGTLPPIFHEQRLIDSIESNEQKQHQFPPDITINKFRNPNPDNKKPNPRTPFQYRRDVQCTCCTTYGHDLDKDICKIGAQVYAVTQYMTKHPSEAMANAKNYALAHNKTKIAMATQHFHPDCTIEEIQDQLLSLAHSFSNNNQNDDDMNK